MNSVKLLEVQDCNTFYQHYYVYVVFQKQK